MLRKLISCALRKQNKFAGLFDDWTFEYSYKGLVLVASPDGKHRVTLFTGDKYCAEDERGTLVNGLTLNEKRDFRNAAVEAQKQKLRYECELNLEFQKGRATGKLLSSK